MTPRPHFQQTSAESLRAFAARRREAADLFGADACEHRRLSAAFSAEGKDRNAQMQLQLAKVKERSQRAAIDAAEKAEARALELEGTSEAKEMVQ